MNDPSTAKLKSLTEEYNKLATALGAGVKIVGGYDDEPTKAENLKVTAVMNTASLNTIATLLMRANVFTRLEYMEVLVNSMTNEVIKYENILTDRFGKTAEGEGVKLGYRNAKPE